MNPEALSRRGWLVRLGGAAALSGIGAGNLDAGETQRLPPGLYEPSLQHLAHSLKVIDPTAAPLLPHYFGAEDFSLVGKIVALVLGEEPSSPVVVEISGWIDMIAGSAADVAAAARSLSPAHRRLAVDYYGEDTVRELESEDPQALCQNGLAALKRAGFETFESNAQTAYLVKLENDGDPFIAWMKRRTLDGFYTSRQGLQELDYKGNAFYAEPPGCDHENRG